MLIARTAINLSVKSGDIDDEQFRPCEMCVKTERELRVRSLSVT